MNYTVVVWGGTILLSLAYFYFPKYGGRCWFKGPVTTATMDDKDETSSSSDRKDGSASSSDGSVHGGSPVLNEFEVEKGKEVVTVG